MNHRRPMTIATHLIWTNYGTWLPNDPRGSTSSIVKDEAIAELGELHVGRKKVQPKPPQVKAFYQAAVQSLKYPVLRFDEHDREIIAQCFAKIIHAEQYTCYACAIMPDHVHLLIRRHRDSATVMMDKLQKDSHLALIANTANSIDLVHPIWTEGGFEKYVKSVTAMHSVIRYIQNNPLRENLPSQHWPFVTPYDNWPERKTSGPV